MKNINKFKERYRSFQGKKVKKKNKSRKQTNHLRKQSVIEANKWVETQLAPLLRLRIVTCLHTKNNIK